MDRKEKKTEDILNKLKRVVDASIKKGKYEKVMAAISVGSQFLYEYNQRYADEDFEEGVTRTAQGLRSEYEDQLKHFHADNNTVLFYDGFGLDTRGVSKIYLSALKKIGYRIIYVTGKAAQGHIPETEKILKEAGASCFFIECKTSYIKWVDELMQVILSTSPKAMLFYTTPYDSAGAVAFALMEGKTDRFLIDLTDHAYWLGVNSNDYFCGSREMSASNQVFERNIDRRKLIKLGVNFVPDIVDDHTGLPFDVLNSRYIFSGGALYKTLGDPEHYYYKIVDHILENNRDIKYLYAGSGDTTEMDKIISKYPDRAYLIPERKDYYYLIENCTLYLNTYPMFGGMMMKYSANAGKLPITLKHDNDSDGLLVNQEKTRIEYDDYDTLVKDVDALLQDEEYLRERESLLEGSVITEERFVRNLRSTIEEHCTDYEHGNTRINVSKFKREFYERFSLDNTKTIVARRINKSIAVYFPWMMSKLIGNIAKSRRRTNIRSLIKK